MDMPFSERLRRTYMTSYVLTLIGNTKPEPLTTAHIEHVCKRLRLTYSKDWLAEDEACDTYFDSTLSAREISALVKNVLSDTAIDSVCTPIAGRRKKILISDMDSTIIDQECIDELGDAIGAGHEIRKITLDVVNGNIGFSDALRQRMALMKGMEYELLERVTQSASH